MKKFKLIATYPDCIIVQKEMEKGCYKIQIRDNEGDVIRSSIKQSYFIPRDFYEMAEKYSLAEIRKTKMQVESEWRKEFVEA